MRVQFDVDDLRRLFEDGSFVMSAFGSDVVKAYRKKVGFLIAADSELDLRNYSALHYEKLKGGRKGQHSIRLNKQWRLILRLESDGAGKLIVVVEIVDYH